MTFAIWILWAALIVLIVWGVKVFIDHTGFGGTSINKSKFPLEILRERYARSEIDKQEFEERRRLLSQ